MEKRLHGYTISKPKPVHEHHQPAEPTASLPVPPSNHGPRPLSDIRELSEPSVVEAHVARPGGQLYSRPSFATTQKHFRNEEGGVETARSWKNTQLPPARAAHTPLHIAENGSSSYSSTPEKASIYSIPQSNVPRRSSSQTHARRPSATSHVRKNSIRAIPSRPHEETVEGFIVPNRGPSRSPVKAAGLRSDAVQSDLSRSTPSHTLVRHPHPVDILEFPQHRHPRVKLNLRVSAPLFVGGGSVEGRVELTVDDGDRSKSRRSLGIGTISVDLLGFEDLSASRKAIFLSLGSELVDTRHPPPANMIEPPNPLAPDQNFCTLTPSTSSLPFMINLPLDTGPPPFQSKHASIRFWLCATALISDAGRHYRVRTSQQISVLSTYDPEKALTSLPSPLNASDELPLTKFGRCETVRVTAGLHRQVWVSGSSIFVDVHISNKTHKPVKRIELSLERDILCYKHAPAGTQQKSASQARIFESNDQAMIASSSLKVGTNGWTGVSAHSSELRTCELELPRGHATVRCGKYFEVRFFLNVTVSLSNSKLVSVQLPIILIHMNSLDVLPNSVAQVAAAIEEKRQLANQRKDYNKQHNPAHSRQRSATSPTAMADLRRRPSYSQGRAFAAPRQQSTDDRNKVKADIDDLRSALDSSPRKYEGQLHGIAIKKTGSSISLGALSLDGGGESAALDSRFRTPLRSRKRNGSNATAVLDKPPSRMWSFGSLRSKRSLSRRQPPEAPSPFTVVRDRIEPHSLGFNAKHSGVLGRPIEFISRPMTDFGFRENLERRRFEFADVQRKASGSLKRAERTGWKQRTFREREGEAREGWI